MNPEQEQELFTTLGRMEAKLDGFNTTLLLHTEHDIKNFATIEGDLQIIKLARAKEEGVAEEVARQASSSGGKWGAVMGTGVSIVIAAVSAYFTPR